MRKSRLFSLLCAFCPGAGEMYLGLMKRGLAIMGVFWGTIALMSVLGVEILIFVLPVVWFYSFFDTLTLRNLDYYALTELQEKDDFLFQDLLGPQSNLPAAVQKYHLLLGMACILIGGMMLYRRVSRFLYFGDFIPYWVYNIFDALPSLLLSFGIIALGVWLVRGKRMPADRVEDYPQYREQNDRREDAEDGKRSA